jgi:hypothetical protein
LHVSVQGRNVESPDGFRKALLRQVDQYWKRALLERRPMGDKAPGHPGSLFWLTPRGSHLNAQARRIAHLPKSYNEAQQGTLTRLLQHSWPTHVARQVCGRSTDKAGSCRHGCPEPETCDHILAAGDDRHTSLPELHRTARYRHDRGVQAVVNALRTAGIFVIEATGTSIDPKAPPPSPSPEVAHDMRLLEAALASYRTAKINVADSHTKPDILAFHPLHGILVIDMSFAGGTILEKMDEIRYAVQSHPHWWDDKGMATPLWGRPLVDPEAFTPLLPLLSLPSVPTALDNALVPVAWDSDEGPRSAHTQRSTQVRACDSKMGKPRANALNGLASRKVYGYSPRARYINRYKEMMTHLRQALLQCPATRTRETERTRAHAIHKADRIANGNGSAVYTRHRIVPLVMGSAGWMSKAMERELILLFQCGKKTEACIRLANKLTYIAYDAALRMHRLWFA